MSGHGTQYDDVPREEAFRQPISHHQNMKNSTLNRVPNHQIPINQANVTALVYQKDPVQMDKELFEEQLAEFQRLLEDQLQNPLWHKKRLMRLWTDVCAKTQDDLQPERQYRGVVRKVRKPKMEKAYMFGGNKVIKSEIGSVNPPVPPRRDSRIDTTHQ